MRKLLPTFQTRPTDIHTAHRWRPLKREAWDDRVQATQEAGSRVLEFVLAQYEDDENEDIREALARVEMQLAMLQQDLEAWTKVVVGPHVH